MTKRYIYNNKKFFDTKKNKEISINEIIRRLNLMNNRIISQQEKINFLQQILIDETGMEFKV